MEELQEFIDNYLRVADFRSISFENPVRFKLQPDTRTFIMAVSYTEPSFSQTPFNVLWICYDRNDVDFYGKLWRRTSADKNPATPNKKYSWVQVTDFEDIYSEDQYYETIDETPSWDMGVSWAEISPASDSVRGFVMISPLTDGTGTKAVLDSDPRLSDKRIPTDHDHNDFPRTMVHIAGTYQEDSQYGDRVNDGEVFVRFSVAKLPTDAGQIFKLTHNNPSRPNEWFGIWTTPTREDFSGQAPVLVSANPYTESGNTGLSDNAQYQLHVDSLYSDNTTIVGDSGTWSISQNTQGITVHPETGLLTVPDISEDTVVNVNVTTVDKNDKTITAQGSISLNLRNTYIPVLPTSIVILGPDSVNEKNGTDYELQVFYSDGTDAIVPATKFVSSDVATATITNEGSFDAKDIAADTTVTLTATYESEGVTLNTTKDALVMPEIKVIGIDIAGPTLMNELTSIDLEAKVSLSDGTSYIAKTSDLDWEFTKTGQGISASANNDSVTYESSEEIDGDETFSVKVSGTFDGVYQEDVHDVTVKDLTVPATPVFFEIIGEDSIEEGSTDEPYSFQVTYDNGVSSIVNALPGSFKVNSTSDATAKDSQVADDGSIVIGSMDSISDITANLTVTLTASYYENGTTVNASKDVIIVAAPAKPQTLVISGPTELDELNSIDLKAHAQMDNGSSILVSGSNSDHSVIWTFIQTATGVSKTTSANAQTFTSEVDINVDETFIVEASVTIEGITVTDQYTVQLKDVPLVPQSLEITGPSTVSENTTQQYGFQVTWSDGSTTTATPDSAGSNNGSFTLDTAGDAVVGEFVKDTSVTLNATFTSDGNTVSGTYSVLVQDIPTLVGLEIVGPTEIQSGDTESYTFKALYSDSSSKSVTPDTFTSDNSDATISGSNVRVGDITSDDSVELGATFSEDGIDVSDTHDVQLKAPVVAQSIEIVGPVTVNEDTSTGYTFSVTYSDGSSRNVTPTTATSDKYTFGEDGQLTVPSVSEDQTVQLGVSYTENGVTLTDTHTVTVTNFVDNVDRVEVTGNIPNLYYAGDDGVQLTATLYYESGATEDITNTGSWLVATGIGSGAVTSTGLFTPDEDIAADTTFVVRCVHGGSNLKGNISIPVKKKAVTLSSIEIVGTSTMQENTSSNFTVEATYSDGTTSNVTGSSTFTLASGSSGSISGSTYTAPEVTSDSTHTIKAVYDGMEDTHNIFVRDIPVPESIRITGTNEIDEGGNSSPLASKVTYSDGTTKVVTGPSTWSTSNPSVLTVSSSGSITSADDISSDTDVTISVSYTEDGITVTDTHVVTVKDAAPTGEFGPRWGTIGPQATGEDSLIRTVEDLDANFMALLDKPLTGVDGEKFLMRGGIDSFDNPDGGFAPYVHNRVYVAYPASLGWAKFVDDINNAGGMDGATAMPDEDGPYTDSAGTVNLSQYANNGGIQVTIDGVDYIIYAQFMSSNNADYEMTVTYGGTDRRSGVL